MKSRPILFSAPMVRALLDGTKTQTRRIVKKLDVRAGMPEPEWSSLLQCCPYGQAGDQLWGRETWCDVYGSGGNERRRKKEVMYRADGETDPNVVPRWTPSIHMPRWASRLTLEITGVRVERLHEITRGDCMAEGCPFPNIAKETDPKGWYSDLWTSINGAGSWDANPWVWVIEFKKVAA